MVTLNFTEDVDNVRSTIIKEDKNNTDILRLFVPTTTTINVGDVVNYKDRSAVLIFSGIVQTRKIGGGEIDVLVYDQGSQLLQRNVNQIFTSTSPEGIIESVVTNFTNLTYVSTISSGITVPTYVANKKRAWDVVTEMADILLANFRVDKNSNFQLETEGDSISVKSLSTTNAILDNKWNEDTTQLVNSVTVDGDDRQIFERDPELFSGTGASQTITLAEIPVDIKVESPLGTVLVGFVEGSTTGDYTLDRENKQITGTFPSGASNIRTTYSTSVPLSVRRRNKTSIDTFGQHDKVFKKPYIKTRSELSDFANFIITRFANPLLSSTWVITSTSDYNAFESFIPNEVITVTDVINDIMGDFIIRKVERDTSDGLRISVGEIERDIINWNKEVQGRVKQLEEKDDNSTILNEDELIDESVQMQFDIDVTNIEQRTFDSDTFYLEDNASGTRNQMLDDGTGPVMRDVGFVSDDIDGLNDIRVSQDGLDTRVSQAGDTRIAQSSTDSLADIGVITTSFQSSAKNNYLTSLSTLITHLATGDDATAPTVGDTTLGNETVREALFTPALVGVNFVQFEIFLDTADNNGNDIKEIGSFDAGAGGNMYNRALTNIISKTASVEVTATNKITVSTIVTDIA